MEIKLFAVGTRMPAWVQSGFDDYARRLRGDVTLRLIEVPAARRSKRGGERALATEAEAIGRALPSERWLVALDERGSYWSTEQLAGQLQNWRQEHPNVCLLIGGADGVAPEWLRRADQNWSLSALTLPHGLVRVIVAEQLYRAWSLLHHHPYHRA
jgi:23S rRNA (pseudouridine1915-N3)-methyltransferase